MRFRPYTHTADGQAGDAMRTRDHRGPDRIIAARHETGDARLIEFVDGTTIDARTAVMRCWHWCPLADDPAAKLVERLAAGETIATLLEETSGRFDTQAVLREMAETLADRMNEAQLAAWIQASQAVLAVSSQPSGSA